MTALLVLISTVGVLPATRKTGIDWHGVLGIDWHRVWGVRWRLGLRVTALLVLISTVAVFPVRSQSTVGDLRTRKTGIDWHRFLGPNGDGKSPEAGILTDWPEDGPRLVWQRKLGEGYAMPSISLGRLFLFERHGNRARLVCLRSETGEELWRSEYTTRYEDIYGYSNGPRGMPLVDGERVYTFGVEGHLRCHRVESGELVWHVDTAKEFNVVQNFFGAGSTPVVEGDLLIVQIGGSPPGSGTIHSGEVRGNGSGVVAFDKKTGSVRYQVSDELASYASPTLATVDSRRWGFVFARGGLLGFEPRTGKVDFFYPWRAQDPFSVNASTPVVVEDTVLVSECYGPGSSLLRVRPGEYEVVWRDPPGRHKSLQTHWNTPIFHDGYLYASSGRHSGSAELRCVEHRTGRVAWSQPGLGRVTLLYVDGHFVVLGEYGQLFLIKATPEGFRFVTGVRKGKSGANARLTPIVRYPAWNPPVLSHGLLYVRGQDRLLCLDLIPAAD